MKLTKEKLYNLIKEEYNGTNSSLLVENNKLDEIMRMFANPDFGDVEQGAEFMYSLMLADEEEPLYGGKYGEITLSFEDDELYNKIRNVIEQRIKDYFNSKYPNREGIANAQASRRIRDGQTSIGYYVGDNPGVATLFMFHKKQGVNMITVTDYSTSGQQ
tara:strand:+ start:55 stop:534 length:480 start_codon:yes stop_codon:yes gene_type:complete